MTAPTGSPHVTRDEADGVATITLHSAGLSSRSRAELTAAFQDVAADDSVRAVILTGSGRAFCVGQDLAEHVSALRADPARALDVVADSYNPMVLALAAVQVPVVAGVNGACVGAGLGLALAADIRVAAAGARLGTAFTGIGLASDSALASRLVACLGVSRATELLLFPEPFSAETALQWGLVHRVADPGQVLPEALALASRLARADSRLPGGEDDSGVRGDKFPRPDPGAGSAAAVRPRADRGPSRGRRGVPGQTPALVRRPVNAPACGAAGPRQYGAPGGTAGGNPVLLPAVLDLPPGRPVQGPRGGPGAVRRGLRRPGPSTPRVSAPGCTSRARAWGRSAARPPSAANTARPTSHQAPCSPGRPTSTRCSRRADGACPEPADNQAAWRLPALSAAWMGSS